MIYTSAVAREEIRNSQQSLVHEFRIEVMKTVGRSYYGVRYQISTDRRVDIYYRFINS